MVEQIRRQKIIKRTKWSVQTNQRFKLYNNVNLALGNGGDLDCHAFWLVCDEEERKRRVDEANGTSLNKKKKKRSLIWKSWSLTWYEPGKEMTFCLRFHFVCSSHFRQLVGVCWRRMTFPYGGAEGSYSRGNANPLSTFKIKASLRYCFFFFFCGFSF